MREEEKSVKRGGLEKRKKSCPLADMLEKKKKKGKGGNDRSYHAIINRGGHQKEKKRREGGGVYSKSMKRPDLPPMRLMEKE